MAENLNGNMFVFRTDVKSYYASLDHDILFRQLQRYVKDPHCHCLRASSDTHADNLDDRMAERCYARFMDDSVILAPTRWKLRRAIRVVNETLAALKVEQHPDKTFIGWISRGFDFLGYPFTPSALGVAAKTIERFAERVTRLYEQGADDLCIGAYVRRWQRWVGLVRSGSLAFPHG